MGLIRASDKLPTALLQAYNEGGVAGFVPPDLPVMLKTSNNFWKTG
jgi:hypothetical protein